MKTFWRGAGAVGVIFWGAALLLLHEYFNALEIAGCVGLLLVNAFTLWKYRWKRS